MPGMPTGHRRGGDEALAAQGRPAEADERPFVPALGIGPIGSGRLGEGDPKQLGGLVVSASGVNPLGEHLGIGRRLPLDLMAWRRLRETVRRERGGLYGPPTRVEVRNDVYSGAGCCGWGMLGNFLKIVSILRRLPPPPPPVQRPCPVARGLQACRESVRQIFQFRCLATG